jgi:hypothetical protein
MVGQLYIYIHIYIIIYVQICTCKNHPSPAAPSVAVLTTYAEVSHSTMSYLSVPPTNTTRRQSLVEARMVDMWKSWCHRPSLSIPQISPFGYTVVSQNGQVYHMVYLNISDISGLSGHDPVWFPTIVYLDMSGLSGYVFNMVSPLNHTEKNWACGAFHICRDPKGTGPNGDSIHGQGCFLLRHLSS